MVPTGKFAGWAVVIDPGWSPEGPRPYVVTSDRQARRLAMIDFPAPVEAMGKVRIPKNFNGRNPQMRRDLASALQSQHPRPGATAARPSSARGDDQTRTHADDEIGRLRDQLRAHPCHDCPDREDHARWAERYFKLDRDAQTLRRRVEQRTNTVARQFDRVCDVLTALDYLEGDTITDRGRHLMRLYSDMDLVAAESIRLGLWDDLSPSGLAAALSVLVFEARRPDDASSPRLPGRRGPRGDRRDGAALGHASTPSSATTSSTSCAHPTSASPGSPTAGPRATTSTTCWWSATSPPATSCAG